MFCRVTKRKEDMEERNIPVFSWKKKNHIHRFNQKAEKKKKQQGGPQKGGGIVKRKTTENPRTRTSDAVFWCGKKRENPVRRRTRRGVKFQFQTEKKKKIHRKGRPSSVKGNRRLEKSPPSTKKDAKRKPPTTYGGGGRTKRFEKRELGVLRATVIRKRRAEKRRKIQEGSQRTKEKGSCLTRKRGSGS